MIRILAVVLVLFAAIGAFAADLELGIKHVITGESTSDSLEVASGRGFSASADVFWSESLSTQFAATFTNPAATLGGVDVGTLGMNAYSVTARVHLGTSRRLSAYAGAGGALVILGDLDDQVGDAIAITFDRQTAFVGEAGLRYRLFSRIYVDAGVIYLPIEADPNVERSNVAVPSRVELEPLIVAVSASWRF